MKMIGLKYDVMSNGEMEVDSVFEQRRKCMLPVLAMLGRLTLKEGKI
jgi:hypothetical protein